MLSTVDGFLKVIFGAVSSIVLCKVFWKREIEEMAAHVKANNGQNPVASKIQQALR